MTDTSRTHGLPAYRPDIDGLRAIAVMAVILYHAGVAGLTGGYAGVDVFFVISGYLITQLLLCDARGERRGLGDFYLRRARRILPALLAVVAVSALVACWVLLPADLTRFGRYLAGVPLLLANWVAWSEGGYFASGYPPAALNHLWSIAVEEQFYLLYPMLLLGILKWLPRRRLTALVVLGGASLVMCIWASQNKPVFNYYAAPTRAWELLLGAVLAVGAFRGLKHRVLNEMLATAGLIIIGLTIALLDSTTPYPGIHAIPVCAATALLIATGNERATMVGRFLSSRPLVFTGLISYSLYLWHLPVFALYGYYAIREPGPLACGLMLALTCVLACITWWTIERPVRARTLLRSNRVFVWTAILGCAAIAATGLQFQWSGGLPQRFSARIRAIQQVADEFHPDIPRCTGLSFEAIRSGDVCRYGPEGMDRPRILVWGDSHAMALLPALESLAASRGVQIYFAAASACGPLLNVVSRRPSAASSHCAGFNASVLEAIDHIDPDTIILAGYWTYLEGLLRPAAGPTAPVGESLFQWSLTQTLHAVAAPGRSVCVVLDAPTLKYPAPYAMAMARRKHLDDGFIAVTRAEALTQSREIEIQIRRLEAAGELRIVDLKDRLCRGQRCDFRAGDKPLYRDTNHLSVAGALFVSPALEGCVGGAAGAALASSSPRPFRVLKY